MNNRSYRIILLLLTIINFSVSSQSIDNKSYKLYSLENNEYTVQVKPDVVNERITIVLNPKETLCISGFKGFEQEIKVLNEKFIELHFKMRGGSGVAIRRYVLICISGVKLCKAIDVLSMVRSEFKETYVPSIDSLKLFNERSIFRLNLNMPQCEGQSFKLCVVQSEEVKSKSNPNKNHTYIDSLELKFDKSNKVFYNQFRKLKGHFDVDSDNGSPTKKVIFNGKEYPTIILKNEEYYYISQKWFIKDRKDHLSEFSDSCK